MLETLFPRHRSYGWVVVAACFACGALSAPGQSYALGLYFEAFMNDLGVSRVSVSSVYAGATLAAAALLPVIGRLADRSSSRVFLATVIAGLGMTLFALAFAQSVVGLAVGLFGLRLLGQGSVGLGTITTVTRWFDKHRGRAAAIAALGYAFGEFTMPALIVSLQNGLGWRGSMMALGGASLLASLLLALVLRDPAPRPCAVGAVGPSRATRGVTNAMRQRVFWVLMALATIVPMVLTGVLLHQLAIFRSVAWDPADAVSALQAYAIANLVVTYGTGHLLEQVPSKFGAAFALTALCA